MGHAYDPTKSRNYKQHVKSVASELNIEPLSGPIRVAMEIYRPLQKSGSKALIRQKKEGKVRPTVKPDVDTTTSLYPMHLPAFCGKTTTK